MKWTSMKAAAAVVLLSGILLQAAPVSVQADDLWSRWQAGDKAAAAGNHEAAVPHWEYVTEVLAQREEWNNAAIFAGKLSRYFDETHQYVKAAHYYELEASYWDRTGNDWGYPKKMRAAQLRSELELFVSSGSEARITETIAPYKGRLAKFEPEYGMYFGIYSELDPKVGNYFIKNKDEYGKKPGISLFYWSWGLEFPQSYISRAKEAGSAVQIAFEPNGGLDEVTDGPYLRNFVRDAKAAGLPIFLRFASEMNGPWVAWHGNPEQYKEKFRLVADVIKEEGADNIAMVWSPNDLPHGNIDSYYPGDEVVDWVGVSLYNSPYTVGDDGAMKSSLQSSPVEYFDAIYRKYASSKPIMISEGGVAHHDNTKNEDFTEWAQLNLQRLLQVLPYQYPRLKAVTYFNANIPAVDNPVVSRSNYLINDSEAVQSTVRGILASPYVLTEVRTGAKPETPVAFQALGDRGATLHGRTAFVPYVRIPEVYIGEIEVALNGATVRTLDRVPFVFELEAAEVPPGSTLSLRVYNRAGALAIARDFRVSPEIRVDIDGAAQQYAQPPAVVNGRTLAPVRSIFEALGAKVTYDASTQTVTGTKGATVVTMRIGDSRAAVNGQEVTLEQPPELIDNRTMAPVRFVGEAFGGKVTWNAAEYKVEIDTTP
ncbi:stalk domain-containing protein [Paenibacillus turpanensis]|uniref:stalk domain-containing protein n=1 Tax=Paenibacillus turpanensis TaxID=2689078 RepID=UPI00140E5C44|nr:stalk domain-containing protein [Paenibacillus turpanensis]